MRTSEQSRPGDLILGLTLGSLLLIPTAEAAFSSGSTGADGPFAPASNTTLTLPASGVFHFTTITIPSGVTVTIAPNAASTPATLLATGDVTIAGTLDLSGTPGESGATGTATFPNGGRGGPGGFAGGTGSTGTFTATGGGGLGPGGGTPGSALSGVPGFYSPHCGGAGGGHSGAGGSGTGGFDGTCSPTGGPAYGGVRLLPLLGGSGGGGGSATFGGTAGGGGGGGGALLLASSTRITLTGTLQASGGRGGGGVSSGLGTGGGGGGSGGAIRLVAPILTGSGGSLQVAGGEPGGRGCADFSCAGYSGAGALGRIRLEAETFSLTATMSVSPSQGPLGAVILPTPPSLRFTSVAGVSAPSSPQGSYGTPDLALPAGFTNPVSIIVEGSQIPPGTTVTVRSTPLQGTPVSTSGGLTGSLASSTATLSLTLHTGRPSVLSAEATFPITASLGSGPLFVDGEEVTHIKVAAALGGTSQLIYLTKSGREIVVR